MRSTHLVAALAMLALVHATHPIRAQGRETGTPPSGWRSAPEYVRLFAPQQLHRDAYKAFVSRDSLETVLARLAADPLSLHPPGAWMRSAELPLDAFGRTGSYDRGRLARLYGAARVNVARGPRGAAGRPAEAWTLLSPYPDPAFQRLEPGTLLIVLDLQRE